MLPIVLLGVIVKFAVVSAHCNIDTVGIDHATWTKVSYSVTPLIVVNMKMRK
jgi:hypothetical protein